MAGQKLTWNAWLELEVPSDAHARRTLALTRAHGERLGGYVERETLETVTLRLPAARLDEALKAIEAFAEVTDRRVEAQDVTSAYVDLKVRVDNARRLSQRLGMLLNMSREVDEILRIERELARATGALERLEAQMRLMDTQTRYACLNVSVHQPIRPGPVGWMFVTGFRVLKWLLIRG